MSNSLIEVRKGKYLRVVNLIKEYEKPIKYRLMSFKKIKKDGKKIKDLLYITPKYTKIKIQDKEYMINKKLIQTDLYTILSAMISIIIGDSNNIFIHSSIVSKNNQGILLLGTFGQGKTTLALEMEKEGFEINSSDNAHLFIKQKNLFMKLGSRYLKHEENVRFLEKNKVNSIIKIKQIILLSGLCDNGDYKKTRITNKNHKIKKIFPFLNWWANSPIITNPNIILENTKHLEMFNFIVKLIRINDNFFTIRGDKRKISFEINREIQRNKE